MKPAYYNEFNKYAAEWLRNLIAAGHISPGDVDERDIRDVRPDDLRGYSQCHFFAGIGVWSYALRRAGWSDDRSVWTGSCPCQPFSAAGAGLGFADERHLWPHFHWLIQECRPATLLGEQVASKDADPWIDLVQADLEGLGYAFGCVPFPSASVGAPHIRDRLYWVAHANGGTRRKGRAHVRGRIAGSDAESRAGLGGSGMSHGLDHASGTGLEGFGLRHQAASGYRQGPLRSVAATGELGGLADLHGAGRSARGEGCAPVGHRPAAESDRCDGGLADAERGDTEQPTGQRAGPGEADSAGAPGQSEGCGPIPDTRPAGPVNGFWRDADWLFCRDGKWRPVEPGTFPLVDGAPARVGRLRAYGNAINAEAARIFVECVMEELR
ncbi:DNA cytosine methyltransferase [Imbroritus primus]|uniref:DNA cytosine methyltransferase n=1 Tax=Imbroritus primus TaxID=3058603 RepID=A0ACD3SQB6_9BURK|nr:DNA cytosine methyltransferase [Burkholderiaceae bacterium PBA]